MKIPAARNMTLLLPLLFLLASAKPIAAKDPVTFTIAAEPSRAIPGETITIWIDAVLSDDWHIYSTTTPPGGPYPTEIKLANQKGFQQSGAILQPEPKKEHDPNFDMVVEYYGEQVRFGLETRVSDSAELGERSIRGTITYMLCNDVSCLPPTPYEFIVPIHLTEGIPREQYIKSMSALPEETEQQEFYGLGSIADVDRAVSEGLASFLYLAFTMGFLALLTPCVFPMVPITVSFFTKQESQSRAESVFKSLVYCGGIVVTFTGLGLLLAATLGASGAALFAANPWINLFITGLFVAFALSLFGLFEIRIPAVLLTRLSSVQGGSYGAILIMGFTFTLTSFTCTAPFVGTLLVLTSQGTWAWPILGMLAFSTAFALPFFFLALFPQGLNALPQSGGWLNSVKVVLGFLELAAALKFLSNADLVWSWGLISREVFLALWIAIFTLCTAYLLGKIRLANDSPLKTVGSLRLLASLGCLAFSLYLVTGLFGSPLGELDAFFPPYGAKGEISQIRGGESLTWRNEIDPALKEAGVTGQPIFIDFTGYACTNCRWMEANIFADPEVRRLLESMILVQLYTDGQGEMHERNRKYQQSRFGTVALPFYAILSPENKIVSRFPGLTRDKDLFIRFLRQGIGPNSSARLPNPTGSSVN
jgi:thiol:disulfide interchange protein